MRLKPLLILVAAAALTAAVPTPKSHFGHEIGADRTVLDWDRVVSYFRALEKESPRVRIQELGRTAEGRPLIAAFIAAPETLQHLDRYIEIQKRLADPRITPAAELDPLIAKGKTVVLITCSIHSTELASTHTAVEFAYRLITEDKPRFRAILENTIFILVPSLNPDGVDIVTQWYRKTLDTPFEGTSPPQLYHKYVGHDNNRDWVILSQPETRLIIGKLHNVWHPQIVYDVHQQQQNGSRIMAPPWLDPIEPNVDAILVQEMNLFGMGIAADLTAAGKTGVSIHAAYDFWSPSRHYQSFHGGLRILTESASARLATPVDIRRQDLLENLLGYNAQERSWNHIEPWPGGRWRMRDIIDYQLIAMESCLYQAASRREEMLRNFYKVGQRQVARKVPFAFYIPAKQADPGATKKLIDTLVAGQVEVEIEADNAHTIRMSQPYSGYAKALLEKQDYPNSRLYPGGPPQKPYDVTAHTLPLLMGVDVRTLNTPLLMTGAVSAVLEQPGRLSASDTDSWRAVNRAWNINGSIWRDPVTGDFSPSSQGKDWKQIKRPRIGLYKSFMPEIDEGWTRWLLEQFGFEYSSIGNKDIQAGGLRQRFDALVFPDQSARSIDSGFAPGSMPPGYTGGLGSSGAAALKEFATAGGTLIFLNHSTDYAIERLGVKAKNVVRGISSAEFYSPGSLLKVQLDRHHPLSYGLPADIPIWSEGSPAWDTQETTVARYPDSGLLASGWLLGESAIARRSALVDAKLGSGHVILFGMRPQYRAQSYLTFKLFFNALLYQ
jgi:Zinc carboxypeptidase